MICKHTAAVKHNMCGETLIEWHINIFKLDPMLSESNLIYKECDGMGFETPFTVFLSCIFIEMCGWPSICNMDLIF